MAGASKPPIVPLRDPIARHARPLIAMLEERIRQEFGMDVLMAFEQEFVPVLTPPKGRDTHHASIVHTMDSHYKVRQYDADARIGVERTSAIIHGYENEISGELYEFQTMPASPLRAVQRIDGQCALLEREASTKADSTLGESVNHALERKYKRQLTGVDYTPVSSYAYADKQFNETVGLHVNFSLWKTKEGVEDREENIIYGDDHEKLITSIKNRLYEYTQKDLLLIAPSPEAYMRLDEDDGLLSRSSFCATRNKKEGRKNDPVVPIRPENARLEFRTPSSDARHDLAALMVMSALYQGLKSGEQSMSPPGRDQPRSYPLACEKFEKESQLVADLENITMNDAPMHEHARELRKAILQAARTNTLRQPVRFAAQGERVGI